MLFSIVAALIYILTNRAEWFLSLHTVSSIICRLFNDSHSDECKVEAHCGFDVHFSNN